MNYPQLSVQLYTVREAIQDDLAGTIAGAINGLYMAIIVGLGAIVLSADY